MDLMIHRLLNLGKFVIFKFQPVTYINPPGKQCNCNFGYNTGILVFNVGIVSADINYRTNHEKAPFKKPAHGFPWAGKYWLTENYKEISPCTYRIEIK